MALKFLKSQILHGSIARRVLLRAFLFSSAMAIFPFLQLLCEIGPNDLFMVNSDGCALDVASSPFLFPGKILKPGSDHAFPILPPPLSVPCKENANLTLDVFRKLIDEKLLDSGAKALCVGQGSVLSVSALQELGFSDALAVDRHRFFSLVKKSFIHGLDFNDNSFDFVFSRALNRVSVPALLVLEMERVLKPGGIGAMLVAVASSNPGNLIKSAAPISSFLKSSDVVHVRSIHSFSLVVFKKKINSFNPFERYQLPNDCPSVMNTKSFIEQLEPVVKVKPVGIEERFSFLPKFIDISSRKKFIYIDIGAGKFPNSNITNWILTVYPLKSQAFDVYVVDHDTSVLSSYVKKPGITFVYHPGLAENTTTASFNPDGDSELGLNEEGFDFLVWFRETVADGNFVVLKMNAVGVELKLLHELFETGAICLVDELFLHCPESVDGQEGDVRGDCMDIFKGLRSSGIFVHQWSGD